jgi:cobalamin biosynthesis protein CobC
MDRLEHGGDPAAAEAAHGRPADGWLDLSTGINPVPYPVGDLSQRAWAVLPDAAAYRSLRRSAARYYGVGDPDLIVPAPGTQALIQWLPRLRAPSRVAIVEPTYGEHAHSWRAVGHPVEVVSDLAALDGAEDVVVIVNPNNPDGRRADPAELAGLAERLASRGGLLVVDEAFADMTPDLSLAARAGLPGLVILRSFGKFFGLAGVRLGFALAAESMVADLTDALGPWAVAGPTAEIGTGALLDAPWIDGTRARLRADAVRLDGLLAGAGLALIGGTTLFRLAESGAAQDLYAHLARQGILIRRFPANSRWLRFGLPGGKAAWGRLEAALAAWSAA